MSRLIYLDNAATTRVAPEVVEAVVRHYDTDYGNPSSSHDLGIAAANAVATARKTLATLWGSRPEEVVFTGGGSEANNLAIFGAAGATRKRGLVVSAIEHPAVLEAARELVNRGFNLAIAPVDKHGIVIENELLDLVDGDTFLVSVMSANNEIGTVQPIRRLARLVKRKVPEVLFHTDAVQFFGKVEVDLADGAIDLLSIAGHKIHAPKGVGALYVRKGTHLRPLIWGGGQERGLRAGTENVPGIVGLIAAASLMCKHMDKHREAAHEVIGTIQTALAKAIPNLLVNGHPEARLPNLLSVSIPGIKSQNLVHFLEAEGVIVSAGSACHSTASKVSHVLQAIGRTGDEATLRISASMFNSVEEANAAAAIIVSVAEKLSNR